MLTGKGGRNYGVRRLKTNGFMMYNSVSHIADFSQFVKNKGLIVLDSRGTSRFSREYMDQGLASCPVLGLSEQISPKSKVHLC